MNKKSLNDFLLKKQYKTYKIDKCVVIVQLITFTGTL